jgi:hypothetical protein
MNLQNSSANKMNESVPEEKEATEHQRPPLLKTL